MTKTVQEETRLILVAEDSPTQAEQLQHILEQHGYEVAVAGNGVQALKLLAGRKPALVLSDIVMPEMDGYVLCRRIRADASLADLPVVLLTSLADTADVLAGLSCGADSFITKPYSEDYLLAQVAQMLSDRKRPAGAGSTIDVDITWAGKKCVIVTDQRRTVTLLISTYEAAVRRNAELSRTQDELRLLNDRLEELVAERTAELSREIAVRRQTEEKLRASEAIYTSLFKNLASGFAYCRMLFEDGQPRDFLYLVVNDAFEAQSGLKDVVGRKVSEILPGIRETDPEIFERYGRVARTGQPERFELFVEALQNWFSVSVYSPAPEHFVSVFDVITGRKRAEKERQELNSQLENRNAELEQFTYTISHELKTPLVTLGGFVGQLRVDLEQGNRDCMGIDLNFIESAASHMGILMGNLLHLARSGRIIADPQPVNLARTAREAVELTRGALAEGMTRIDVADDLPEVSGDADRLREVFQKLLENAVRFARDRQPAQIEIGARADGDQVLCWVRDNGIGIPAKYQQRVFRLFEKLEPSGEGTGLGLAIVHCIIREHGGRVWVESAGDGCGSTFFFTLPAETGAAGASP